jgi:hypothetical protein
MGPALGQMLLEGAQRVEVGQRRERLRQRLDRDDPAYAQHAPRLPGVLPAQQVQAAVPQHDGPRVDPITWSLAPSL